MKLFKSKHKLFISLKVITVTAVMFFQGMNVYGQQDPAFTNYMFNPLSINPAYAGSNEAFSALLLHRSQWVGFKGAPTTNTLSLHSAIRKYNLGVGFSLVQDEIGPIKQTSLYGDIAYQIKVSEKSKVALGIKTGFNNYRGGFTDLLVNDENDGFFENDVSSKVLPNFGFGAYYYHEKYYVGLSIPKLLTNSLSEFDINTSYLYREKRHTFLTAGYVFKIHPGLHFKPTALLRAVPGAPASLDLSANFLFHEKLWVGAYTRLGDSFGILTHYWLNNQFRIGYSYDYAITPLTNYTSGSHEVVVSYDLYFKKGKIKSPRHF